jgi:hypothetical protein
VCVRACAYAKLQGYSVSSSLKFVTFQVLCFVIRIGHTMLDTVLMLVLTILMSILNKHMLSFSLLQSRKPWHIFENSCVIWRNSFFLWFKT